MRFKARSEAVNSKTSRCQTEWNEREEKTRRICTERKGRTRASSENAHIKTKPETTTPKQKIIPRESTQVGSRRLSPAEKASIMPDGNNLPFKLPKYDVNPKKSKAMLSETEPPCIDNGASAMEVDSPVTEKEIAPSKSTITITPVEKPIVEQPVQKQSMAAQAAVRPANKQSIELSEVGTAPIV